MQGGFFHKFARGVCRYLTPLPRVGATAARRRPGSATRLPLSGPNFFPRPLKGFLPERSLFFDEIHGFQPRP